MKAVAISTLMFAAHVASAMSLTGQTPAVVDPMAPAARGEYAAISGSVVRLRTTASVELTLPDPSSGLRSVVNRPLSIHGSGVVIGQTEVDGRVEYLVITNHHVADPTNYVVQEGRFLRENRNNTRAVPLMPEETFLTLSENGEDSPDDIPMIEVARDVRGDMTLMRTVGATRDFPIFTGAIGFRPGEMTAGTPVITTGFPNGGQRFTDTGTILEIDHLHELGEPHEDFVLSLPIEHGQSGSPVFVAMHDDSATGPAVEFVLIGLLHARENGTSYMVPTTLWQHALDLGPEGRDVPGLLAGRE